MELNYVAPKGPGELMWEWPLIGLEYRGCSEIDEIKYVSKRDGKPAVMYKLQLNCETANGEQIKCVTFADDARHLHKPPFVKGDLIIVVVNTMERLNGSATIMMANAFAANGSAPKPK